VRDAVFHRVPDPAQERGPPRLRARRGLSGPVQTARIRRFGEYVLDLSPPGAAQAHLELDETDQVVESTR